MKVTIKKTNRLEGKIKISGSKNSALPILAISLLTSKKLTLTNVPMICDIYHMIEILEYLGVKVKVNYEKNEVTLKRRRLKNKLLLNATTKIRASYYLYPGLINYHKRSHVLLPGGCNFSIRPIDYHLELFRKTNVKVEEKEDGLSFTKSKLRPSNFFFKTPTVGATINAILQTVLIKGTSIIHNQPLEPEIEDVINCLNKMGAKIKIKENMIIIKGVRKLKKVTYQIMPDRIELGSYLLLCSAIPSKVTFTNIEEKEFTYLSSYLDEQKINYIYNKEGLTLDTSGKLNNVNLTVSSYPSFPTDLQPILCASLLVANGTSEVTDHIYPNRISHLKEFEKMNALTIYENNKIIINQSTLKGSTVYAHDLRCGFALIVCAALSEGESKIEHFEVINRGYENIIPKLKSIGMQINENLLK